MRNNKNLHINRQLHKENSRYRRLVLAFSAKSFYNPRLGFSKYLTELRYIENFHYRMNFSNVRPTKNETDVFKKSQTLLCYVIMKNFFDIRNFSKHKKEEKKVLLRNCRRIQKRFTLVPYKEVIHFYWNFPLHFIARKNRFY